MDELAPLAFAALQLGIAVLLALPALGLPFLRRPLKLTAVTSLFIFAMVAVFVLVFDQTSPTGAPPLGATLYVALVGGVVWATAFFMLAYVPLALLAFLRSRR